MNIQRTNLPNGARNPRVSPQKPAPKTSKLMIVEHTFSSPMYPAYSTRKRDSATTRPGVRTSGDMLLKNREGRKNLPSSQDEISKYRQVSGCNTQRQHEIRIRSPSSTAIRTAGEKGSQMKVG